jgi:signal transduction histidine kinase
MRIVDTSGWINRLSVAAGVAMLLTLVVVLLIPDNQAIAPTRFARAQLCTEAPVATPLSRAGLSTLLSQQLTVNCGESVVLPHRVAPTDFELMRTHVERLGRAWVRLHYVVPAGSSPDEPIMIYSPRVTALAWQVRVNGASMLDDLDDWRMTLYRPLAVILRTMRLKAGDDLDIAIVIAFEPPSGASVARISVGPASALARRLAIRQFLGFVMPMACSVTLLALGAFFLLFWWLRRAERTHVLLALSAIAWCVFNLQYVLPRYDDAGLDAWYSAIIGPSITWVMWLIYLFVLQLDARFSRVVAFVMPPFVLLMTLIASPILPLNEDTGVFFQGANVTFAAFVTVYICWMAVRGGSLDLRVISLALALTIIAGAHDLGMLAQTFDAEGIFWLPYTGIALFGSFLFAVQRRYVHALDEHERLTNSLSQQLSQREAELRANHLRLVELEKAQALATERQRLMHDIHDGVGSALTTSLAMMDHDHLDKEELRRVLRDSVDDLRAVIDSLEPLDGDLVSVLATLRFRLGKRLELAGIAVEWHMHDLPPLQWLGPPQALQMTRIVQEVLTNILKHAAASSVRISACCSEPYIEVCIADNGRGFDTATVLTGRGLRYVSQRAASLHGSVVTDSRPGAGTSVRLLLPISIKTGVPDLSEVPTSSVRQAPAD